MTDTVKFTLHLPSVDVIGGTDNTIVSGNVNITARVPSLAISGVAGFFGITTLNFPIFAVATNSGQGGVAGEFPSFSIAIAGSQGNYGDVVLAFPAETLVVSGITGITGGVVLSTPQLSLVSYQTTGASNSLPSLQLQVSGQVGTIGSVFFRLPAETISVAGTILSTGAVSLSVVPSVSVSGIAGIAGSISNQLRQLVLATTGVTGNIGSAQIVLPVVVLDSAGVENQIGHIALSLPIAVLQATGRIASGVTSSTIVMHTENQALTTYSNYGFNSFTNFNGVYLAANATGVFALTGDTDDGAIINASARVGITDFGSSHLKRVDRMYIGYRTSGDMILRVFTDETNARDYLLAATGKAGIHGNHVRIGKGLAARYWQFEIANTNGSNFELNIIEAKPTILRRRIGGNDA